MDAPYSETTRSALESGSGTDFPGASSSGNSMPVSAMQRRAVSSCAGVGSTPTGRAPRFASHAETYAVPHPSSTTSRPFTSGSAPTCDSGMPHVPQSISACSHFPIACWSVYSRFERVQSSRLTATESGSDEAIGEEQLQLPLGARFRVRAVDDVLRKLEREVAANRARSRAERIRGAHHRAHDGD